MIVGIGYQKFSGKDTAAAYLVEKYGFVRRAFADALKEEVLRTWQKTIMSWWEDQKDSRPNGDCLEDEWETYRDRIKSVSGEPCQTNLITWLLCIHKPPFIVSLLQEHGTELRRGDDAYYWTRAMAKWIEEKGWCAHNYVIPDVRFWNEATFVKSYSGKLICLNRDADRSAFGIHSSEDGDIRIRWHYTVDNNGTIPELHTKLDTIMEELGICAK